MNPLEFLLAGFLAIMALGTLTLVSGTRSAMEGFEDLLGFHFGEEPELLPRVPGPVSAFEPAHSPRASVPTAIQERREPDSKPPLLPNNLSVADLNPLPAMRAKRARRSHDRNELPGQVHFSFPTDQSPAM